MPEDFLTNVARVTAAIQYFSLTLQAAREMYGKSYFALGVQEKLSLDQAVFANVGANYQSVTPENLQRQTSQQPAGFQVQSPKTTE